MSTDPIPSLLARVDRERMAEDVFYLAKQPLPCRTLNRTLPGHDKSTLEEADDFIQARLESWGYTVEREPCPVQAFRRDTGKPLAHQYSPPLEGDRRYTANNLYVTLPGQTRPGEIVLLMAHKDSQSWIASPGAHDNAVGTVAIMEIARVLATTTLPRSVRFLFCNEEHTPWTSVTAAKNARQRGDRIVAAFNIDGLSARNPADAESGRMTNFTRYSVPEGKWVADLMAEVNQDYGLGLVQQAHLETRLDNDDGSFVREGYLSTVHNVGSIPYGDPNYHVEGDVPELVDTALLALATKATLAAVLRLALRQAP